MALLSAVISETSLRGFSIVSKLIISQRSLLLANSRYLSVRRLPVNETFILLHLRQYKKGASNEASGGIRVQSGKRRTKGDGTKRKKASILLNNLLVAGLQYRHMIYSNQHTKKPYTITTLNFLVFSPVNFSVEKRLMFCLTRGDPSQNTMWQLNFVRVCICSTGITN